MLLWILSRGTRVSAALICVRFGIESSLEFCVCYLHFSFSLQVFRAKLLGVEEFRDLAELTDNQYHVNLRDYVFNDATKTGIEPRC